MGVILFLLAAVTTVGANATAAPAVSAVSVVSSSSAVASTNMPPSMVAVWKQAQRELRRTGAHLADGALDDAGAAKRREAVGRAFVRVCREKKIPEADIVRWRKKLYE